MTHYPENAGVPVGVLERGVEAVCEAIEARLAARGARVLRLLDDATDTDTLGGWGWRPTPAERRQAALLRYLDELLADA